MTKSKIYGTFIEIHHSMTLKNGEDFSCRSKGRLDCGQRRENLLDPENRAIKEKSEKGISRVLVPFAR